MSRSAEQRALGIRKPLIGVITGRKQMTVRGSTWIA